METFPRYCPFVRGIHRWPVKSPHKGQWRGALMFSLIYARINGWVNNSKAGDLRRHRGHYDVIVMKSWYSEQCHTSWCNNEIQIPEIQFVWLVHWYLSYCNIYLSCSSSRIGKIFRHGYNTPRLIIQYFLHSQDATLMYLTRASSYTHIAHP